MSRSKVEWTNMLPGFIGESWSPVDGCTPVSAGCANCWAKGMAKRFWKGRNFWEVRCHPERLGDPARWRKPRLVFVCPMGDLFHRNVPFEFIGDVFDEMICHPKHIFLVLTKRPEVAVRFAQWYGATMRADNIWIGVSVENQETADKRIPLLLEIPAAVRFVSAEPLLGPVDFTHVKIKESDHPELGKPPVTINALHGWMGGARCGRTVLDWVIAGGESGPKARPMCPNWVWSLWNQCQETGTAFFFKQWGAWCPTQSDGGEWYGYPQCQVEFVWLSKVGKHKAGRLLDGQEWNEYPVRAG